MTETPSIPNENSIHLKWYQSPQLKTLVLGFIWALLFSLFIPSDKLTFWQYSFFLSSVPSTLIWDWFGIQSITSTLVLALINSLIFLSPYWVFLKFRQTYWWFYLAISSYAFINAALGFIIIISLRDLPH